MKCDISSLLEALRRIVQGAKGDSVYISYRDVRLLCKKLKLDLPTPHQLHKLMKSFNAERNGVFTRGGKVTWILRRDSELWRLLEEDRLQEIKERLDPPPRPSLREAAEKIHAYIVGTLDSHKANVRQDNGLYRYSSSELIEALGLEPGKGSGAIVAGALSLLEEQGLVEVVEKRRTRNHSKKAGRTVYVIRVASRPLKNARFGEEG